MISAVVSAFHTFSGGWAKKSSATMSRVSGAVPAAGRRAGLVIVHLLQYGPEVGKALAPEDGVDAEPVDQRRQSPVLAAIVDEPALPPLAQQARLLPRTHVLGDRRLGAVVLPGQRAHGQLACLGDLLEHRAPRRVAQHAHDGRNIGGREHEPIYKCLLIYCQRRKPRSTASTSRPKQRPQNAE